MTPEYLNELANMADPDQLWQISPLDQINLAPELRKKLDTGVALRRYAEHVHQLHGLLGTGRSLVLTPISSNGTAVMTITAPPNHQKLLRIRARHSATGTDKAT